MWGAQTKLIRLNSSDPQLRKQSKHAESHKAKMFYNTKLYYESFYKMLRYFFIEKLNEIDFVNCGQKAEHPNDDFISLLFKNEVVTH